jgi:hypothetical protein
MDFIWKRALRRQLRTPNRFFKHTAFIIDFGEMRAYSEKWEYVRMNPCGGIDL